MSDISLQFNPLEIAIFFAALYVVPIAVVTAAIAFWYARARSRVSLVLLVIAAIPCLAGVGTRLYIAASDWQSARAGAAYVATHTRTLERSERVLGATLPAGTMLQREDASSTEVFIDTAVPVTIAGVPIVGEATYGVDGIHAGATLARDAMIAHVRCRAGPAKFDRGTLAECTAARAQTVRGIPCVGDVYLEDFDRSPLGVACTVATDFRMRGVRVSADSAYSFGTVTVADEGSTSIRLRGRGLSKGARVIFEKTDIALYDVSLKIGTCDADIVTITKSGGRAIGYDVPHQRVCRVGLPPGSVTL